MKRIKTDTSINKNISSNKSVAIAVTAIGLITSAVTGLTCNMENLPYAIMISSLTISTAFVCDEIKPRRKREFAISRSIIDSNEESKEKQNQITKQALSVRENRGTVEFTKIAPVSNTSDGAFERNIPPKQLVKGPLK